jgi:hypothetical protein
MVESLTRDSGQGPKLNMHALMRVALGLILGAALSFLVGCIYAYCMWHPPSNDWGNEKVIATLFCAPLVFIVLLIVLVKFRHVRRLAAHLIELGRVGLAAVLIGGLLLPIAQVSESIAARNASALQIPVERAKIIAEFGDLGSRLRVADSIIVETGSMLGQQELNRFVARLSDFTSKPVFITVGATAKSGISLDRSSGSGTPNCATAVIDRGKQKSEVGNECLTRTNLPSLRDWPTQGDLIDIAEYYPSQGIILGYGRFKRASDEPPNNYHPHFPLLPGSQRDLRQWCEAEQSGPFPFGRGMHWHVCTERLTLEDIGNGVFGTDPRLR